MTSAPPTSYPIFNTPPELATGVKQAGFKACSIAGNHWLDQGQNGIDQSNKILDKAGVRIARSLVGPYITSLDMAGCSVTLLRADDDLLRLWDHPVNTPALRRGC